MPVGLLRDQQQFDLWHGFYEPPKADEFFPTYKKHEMSVPNCCFAKREMTVVEMSFFVLVVFAK